MDNPTLITALVLPVGDEPAYLTRITPDLDTMKGIVGGWLQALGIASDAAIYMNEDGKYAGLPVNPKANKLVTLADLGLMPGDFIVGQVVVTGIFDAQGRADGVDHDVPASVLDLCARAGIPVEDRTAETGTAKA